MRRLINLLLVAIFLVSGTWSTAQVQLPIWNVLTPYITNPYDGDTVDGKFAALPYVDVRKAPTGVLKYNALRFINTEDHYTLSVHARIPSGVGFYITSQTDTSTFGVLYTYQPQWSDNQTVGPKDTVLTIDVPAGQYRYKYPGFYRFAIIRFWQQRQSYDTMFVDALSLKVHDPVLDTIVTPHDDTIIVNPPQDTIPAKVTRQSFDGSSLLDHTPPVDILGRPVSDTTKSGVYFIRGRKKVVAE
jgi:hypothetical protein